MNSGNPGANAARDPSGDAPSALGVVPDLCHTQAVLRLIVVGQLLAAVLVLADSAAGAEGAPDALWMRLLMVSLLVHWLSLGAAAMLCLLRHALARLPLYRAVALVLVLLQLLALVVSGMAGWGLRAAGLDGGMATEEFALFVARVQIIHLLVWMVLLRYFYVQYQWQQQVQAAAAAQLQALQARIRPHFLFNALNSLAALIPTRPADAEALVENLAELLRAALDRPDGQHPLADELALTRTYLAIEQLRLGSRLQLRWEVPEPPPDVDVPVLSLQPLVENAVYHGIERLPQGGEVLIAATHTREQLHLCVHNPCRGDAVSAASTGGAGPHDGWHLAHHNIRQRLALMYGPQASLIVTSTRTDAADGRYVACLRLPWPATSRRNA
ncbi:MAG: histidine kinase [Oceanococcaceae bacterium]